MKSSEASVAEERERLEVVEGTLKLREESLVEQRDELVSVNLLFWKGLACIANQWCIGR